MLNHLDFTINTFNTGSSWFPKYTGVKVTYTPTGEYEESSIGPSQHSNYRTAWDALINRITKDNKQLELF